MGLQLSQLATHFVTAVFSMKVVSAFVRIIAWSHVSLSLHHVGLSRIRSPTSIASVVSYAPVRVGSLHKHLDVSKLTRDFPLFLHHSRSDSVTLRYVLHCGFSYYMYHCFFFQMLSHLSTYKCLRHALYCKLHQQTVVMVIQ